MSTFLNPVGDCNVHRKTPGGRPHHRGLSKAPVTAQTMT